MTPTDIGIAHLYKITHIPTGLVYWGSTWGKGKTIYKRFKAHMSGHHSAAKWITKLITEGASVDDFITELMLIGPVEYVCDIEMNMAKDNLWPKGLNGNAGKNIVRSEEGQRVVSSAVSKAKLGRTKENSEGVAIQAAKLAEQKGENRTEKQKEWDKRKSAWSIANDIKPPVLPIGSKMMNNGQQEKFISPKDIKRKEDEGWVFGYLVKRHLANKGLKTMRRDGVMIHVPLEEVDEKLLDGWLLGNGPQKNPRKKK